MPSRPVAVVLAALACAAAGALLATGSSLASPGPSHPSSGPREEWSEPVLISAPSRPVLLGAGAHRTAAPAATPSARQDVRRGADRRDRRRTPRAHQGSSRPAAGFASRCANPLARTLHRAGFRGGNLVEAWAIAMRESRGQNVVPGHPSFNGNDYSIFQFNRPTFAAEGWWDAGRLADPAYAAAVAYRLSDGGRTWYPWGLDGKGRANAGAYRASGWSSKRVASDITRPFETFRARYPCSR